jgi:hypothetical protein
MPVEERDDRQARLRISEEEARRVASLLRYAVSLNTTAGLISPTERRLATNTYKATELAALLLEGKSFEEALEESQRAWSGSLEEDHRRALSLLQSTREELKESMAALLSPEATAEFLEVQNEQFRQLVRPVPRKRRDRQTPPAENGS